MFARPPVHFIHPPDIIRLILHIQSRQTNDERYQDYGHENQPGNNDYFKHSRIIQESVSPENIPGIDLLPHIVQTAVVPVGDNGFRLLLEPLQTVHHPRTEESRPVLQRRLVNDDVRTFRLDPLHHPLDAALAEIVAIRLHGQPVHADGDMMLAVRIPLRVGGIISGLVQHLVGNEILARSVRFHNGMDQVLRHVRIVGQQLFRVLRQAVAPVSERWVVVVRTDARVQADAVDDGLRVQPLHLRIRVQLVEVAHPQCQIRVGEQLHRLGLLHAHKQSRNIFLDSPFLQQRGKFMRLFFQIFSRNSVYGLIFLIPSADNFRIPYDDTAGVQVVIQRLAFAQELGREQQVEPFPLQGGGVLELSGILHVQAPAIPYRNGALDDHHRIRIHLQHQVNHLLHMARVKVILHGVIVRGSGNHHKVRVPVGRSPVQRGGQVQLLLGQILLDVFVLNRTDTPVYLLHLFRYHVHGPDLMVLGKQGGDGQAHIARSGHSDCIILHCWNFQIIRLTAKSLTTRKLDSVVDKIRNGVD